MATIIYQTNTGSSEKYAQMLSEKTGYPCVSLAKSGSIPADEEIIFIGWVMMNEIQGLKQIRDEFSSIRCICAVGVMNAEKNVNEVKAKNNITEPFFFLQGDFNVKKLSGMHRMVMSMMIKMLEKEMKTKNDPVDNKIMEVFVNGIEFLSEDNLQPVLDFLSE